MQSLFDTSDFPQRWNCGNWTALHGWVHIVSDIVIGLAYFAIPALFVYFLSKRRDVAFPTLGWLFAAFILSCGATHFIEASIFWTPWYRLSGAFKVVTALVSVVTAVAMARLMPMALTIPGMAAMNEFLRKEIEQREQYEAELRSKNLQLDHFASMASHDLKSPLRAIRNLADWVEEDCTGKIPEESEQHLNLLRERVDRMDNLLDGLLDFARAGADVTSEQLDLRTEAEEAIALLDVPDGVKVEVEDLPSIQAPRAAVRLILRNLISNSLKHGDRPDLVVHVRSRIEGRNCVLEVEDNGVGIPEESAEAIFDLFTLARDLSDPSSHGLGLAAVRRTAETIGGHVELSTGSKEGARFVVTIPMEPDHVPAEPVVA